ncbi:AI-2E family transporter [Weissella halotolerans]|uniref:Permease n=1 Tax=Weissella halotolerans DSM 20190 TaxID=1123500 RepID=A0A0R2FSG3_9LACO|nr:AI-2E family transporter [Weissella halotolerans]KRN31288.1 permease [Weissella halotolerans DSM 20190]
MHDFVSFIKRKDTQRYLALLLIIACLVILHKQLSIILLTIIFSYLSISNANRVSHRWHLPYIVVVLALYLVVVVLFFLALRFVLPVLIDQFMALPKEINRFFQTYPAIQGLADEAYKKFDILQEVIANWRVLLASGWGTVSTISRLILQVLLAAFLSFVLALTWQRLKRFGHQFLTSDYPHLFMHIYELGGTFISILGSVIEVQLKIALINSVLMVIGLFILKVPSVLVMGVLIFILGLIPIAGVLISLIPLSVVTLAANGPWGVLELWVLITIIHLFEAYFLHPHLMANRTELPVFVTFATLIIMEHLLGAWGLIIGVPIVAFFLNLIGVQRAAIADPTNQGNIENNQEV